MLSTSRISRLSKKPLLRQESTNQANLMYLLESRCLFHENLCLLRPPGPLLVTDRQVPPMEKQAPRLPKEHIQD